MNDHAQRAEELFDSGCNCAQSVLGAFCEELGMDFETAMKLASSFGGGIGGLHEVCGAISGMSAAAGLAFGYADPSDKTAKTEHYGRISRMAKRFEHENGSLICRELLTRAGATAPGGRHRPCSAFVRRAAEIMEDELRLSEQNNA